MAVSKTSPLMRRFENARYSTHDARSPRRFISPTAGAPHINSFCIFTWSSDRALTRAVGGPRSFWGPLALRSLKRAHSRARLLGLMSVFWIPGYTGPPAPGPLQRPSFGPGVERQPKPGGEDPHEEAPHEENNS
jgi:hypothetical protein